MTINIPEKWRGVLYIVCGIGSIVVTYLAATGVLGAEEVAAWTGFTAFVAAVARFNLGSSPDARRFAGSAAGNVTDDGGT